MDVSVFNAVKKPGVRYVSMTTLKKCVTRSNCVTSSGVIRINGLVHRVFVKVSPCVSIEDERVVYSANERQAKRSPQYVEIRMFKITNRLNTKNVCRSFVYMHNDHCLQKSIHHSDNLGRFDTILVTEDISSFVPFYVFLRKANNEELACVLFQLVYTLQCMNTIRLTHTDMHFGNLFVKRRPELVNHYDTYEYKHDKRYIKTKIPCEHQLKIIDLDGAHKHPVTGLRRFTIRDKHFAKGVKNHFHEWGTTKTVNARFDLMKVLFHLRATRPDIRGVLRAMGFVNSGGRVPYYDFNPKHNFDDRDVVGVNQFGMYYNNHGDFLNLTDAHVLRPKDIVKRLSMYIDAHQSFEYDSISQRGLL